MSEYTISKVYASDKRAIGQIKGRWQTLPSWVPALPISAAATALPAPFPTSSLV